jgi:uncharacterized protein YjbJ (UPF0337 family)
MVNWERVAGNWSQIKGVLQEQWGDLTDDDLLQTRGEKNQLIGALQRRYGMTREEAETALHDFFEGQRQLWERDGG